MSHPFNERLLIGGGTLAAFLLAWEITADTGLIDPLFISSPSRMARAGAMLAADGVLDQIGADHVYEKLRDAVSQTA